jgi:hypothetical protein
MIDGGRGGLLRPGEGQATKNDDLSYWDPMWGI